MSEVLDSRNDLGSTTTTASASPIKIAGDFIMQYYCVRFYYPESLYRFYHEDATLSMTTNSNDPPICGKMAIKEHFVKVDYVNSHSRVMSYTAHFVNPTVLVIFVSGELNNKGELPRRFSEVFCLIRNTVDSFCLKSHMFHYQDEVGLDTGSEIDTENNAVANSMGFEPVSSNNTESIGDHHVVENTPLENVVVKMEPIVVAPTATTPVDKHVEQHSVIDIKQEPVTVTYEFEQIIPDQVEPRNEPLSNVPPVKRTWANIAHNGTSTTAAVSTTTPTPVRSHINQEHQANSDINSNEVHVNEKRNGTHHDNQKFQQRGHFDRNGKPKERHEGVSGGGAGGNRNRFHGNGTFPKTSKSFNKGVSGEETITSCQLFVGNLPKEISEDKLRGFFSTFGPVGGIRIYKSSRENFPDYGFVEMQSDVAVKEIISNTPLHMDGGHRLNVEVKREGGGRRDNNANRGGGGGGARFANRQ